jgi:hypothetical protein
MTESAALVRFSPAWTASLAAMRRPQIRVRARCRRCGALVREDVDALIGLYGEGASLIDRQARCRMVGCDGAAYYLAARGYDGPWHVLLHDERLRAGLADCPPAQGANGEPIISAQG